MDTDIKSSSDFAYDLDSISSGVKYLVEGYISYAEEVIVNRALANLYDGLKPVNRRILYTLHKDNVWKNYMKSARVAGNTLALHPHGDDAIYLASVLMTQRNGSYAFPLIDGSGDFGGVYKDSPPAAKRYTEEKLHENAKEFFNELDGIDMIPNFDSTMSEPMVLPVSFPSVLVNSTTGIAVGFKSNIPSFNFNDVCDLVIEYIDKGSCSTIIEPDFVTGGYYVKNNKELLKLMKGGKAKLKLRAKTVVDGKKIIITEVPFGKTIQRLIKQINDLDDKNIRNAYNTDDFTNNSFVVDCKNKNVVDTVYYRLIKDTDLQYSFSADITVVQDGKPRRLGVWSVIEEWVKWRRNVLNRYYRVQYDNYKEALREANAFMNIVNAYEKRMKLVEIIASKGRDAGRTYIEENWSREEVPADLIDFCASRSLPMYHDGGKFLSIYNSGMSEIKRLENILDNIDDFIKNQMLSLKSKYGSSLPRKTEVTTKDYEFLADTSSESVIDNSICTYEFKDGFLKKLNYASGNDCEYRISGTAGDTLIAFDNRGRLLRVYCQDIPYDNRGMGIYLPSYFGLDETEDYKITWIGKLDGSELMLLYKDGNVGFVDTNEWNGANRNVKVLINGISASSAPYLGAVLTEIPEMLYVSDEDGNLSWAFTKDIKHKDRTAKTRVFNLRKKCMLDSFLPISFNTGSTFINNYGDYQGTLKKVKDLSDIHGDVDAFKLMF